MKIGEKTWKLGTQLGKLEHNLKNWNTIWNAIAHLKKLEHNLKDWNTTRKNRRQLENWNTIWNARAHLEKLEHNLKNWNTTEKLEINLKNWNKTWNTTYINLEQYLKCFCRILKSYCFRPSNGTQILRHIW